MRAVCNDDTTVTCSGNLTLNNQDGRVCSYKYNAKELETALSLGYYNFGRRMYDPTIARFMVPDRFAEKYYNLSPYQYGGLNPIRYIDVNGDSLWIKYDGNNYLYEGGQLYTRGDDGKLALYKGNLARLDKNGSVKGYKGLLGTTVGALGGLQNRSNFADKMISSLQTSENNFTIKPADNAISRVGMDIGNGRTGVLNNNAYAFQVAEQGSLMVDYASFNNIGSGGDIHWNPRDGTIGLAHELGHAYDANFGWMDSRMVEINGGIEYIREIRAVYYENRIRQEMSMPYRSTYSPDGPRLLDVNNNPIFYPNRLKYLRY